MRSRGLSQAYARWEFNHTNQWIDSVFATQYRAESALYASLAPSLPKLVASDDGLDDDEKTRLRVETADMPSGHAEMTALGARR